MKMKTLEIKIQHHATDLLSSSLSAVYNKIERIVKFNRTNYINSKQYDFTNSVDCHCFIPQICFRNYRGNKTKNLKALLITLKNKKL